jgi:uncharacterized membrane protein YkvA (DUF1232 family)
MDTNEEDMNNTERFQGFYESLKETIKNYSGEYEDLVKHCPELFDLLCKIINDKYADWNTKLMIGAALAYFVLPEDIIPDNEEAGYVDDLFIVCHVLKEIKDKVSADLITANWEGEADILHLVDDIYDRSSRVVAKHTIDILRKVGLQKYESMDLYGYSGSYKEKLVRLGNEKRELLGLLAFLVKQFYRANVRGWKMKQIEDFLKQHGDYDEITRLIELSKMNNLYSPSTKPKEQQPQGPIDIETRLRAARMRALVEENTDKLEE